MIISKFTPLLKNIKIKPSELGYVRPDGTIKFQTPESAGRYARNVVVQALNTEKPFERAVFIDGSTIIKQVDGNEDEVRVLLGTQKFDTSVHGHPDTYAKGVTTPISTDDMETFFHQIINNEAKKAIVYNSKGEYSSVEVILPEHYDKMPEILKKNVLILEFKRKLALLQEMIANMEFAGILKLEALKATGKLEDYIKEIPKDKVEDFLPAKVITDLSHKLWKNSASKLNIKYDTNFSNLV